MGIQIPNECLSGVDQFPTNIDRERKLFEVGIPASCILQPLNAELDRFEAENEKSTDFQRIRVDVEAFLREGGILVNGSANGQFRELLFKNPITGKKHYTPWFSATGVGAMELDVSLVDETIKVKLAKLNVSGNPGKWYEELVKYAFGYLFKDKAIAKINEAFSKINGVKVQQLFFNLKGAEKARSRLQELGLTSEKLDELLGLVKVNVRLSPDYFWLSVQL